MEEIDNYKYSSFPWNRNNYGFEKFYDAGQGGVGWSGCVHIYEDEKSNILIQNNGAVVKVFNQSDKRLDVVLKKHLKLHKICFVNVKMYKLIIIEEMSTFRQFIK
jgi:hypothetical protein